MNFTEKNYMDFYHRSNNGHHPLQSVPYDKYQSRLYINGKSTLGQDNRNYNYNGQRLMNKVNELSTDQDLLSEMRCRYPLSLVREKFTNNDFDAMQGNYKTPVVGSLRETMDIMKCPMTRYFLSDRSSNYHQLDTQRQSALYTGRDIGQERDTGFREPGTNSAYESSSAFQRVKILNSKQYLSSDSYCNRTVKSYRTDCNRNLIDRYGNQRTVDQTKEIGKRNQKVKDITLENRKRKRMMDSYEVIDLTSDTTDQNNESKIEQPEKGSWNAEEVNNSKETSDNSNVETETRYFAPYEDYEAEFEEVDEDSLLAKHQRYYKTVFGAKQIKTNNEKVKHGCDTEKVNTYSQFHLLSGSSAPPAHLNKPNEDIEFTDNETDGQDSEAGDESPLRINPDLCGETDMQDVAIDYSMKSKTETNIESNNKEVEQSVGLSTDPIGSSNLDKSSVQSETSVHSLSPCMTLNRNVASTSATQNKSVPSFSNDKIKSLIEYVLNKSYNSPVQDKNGLAKTVAEFGRCLLLAQNNCVLPGSRTDGRSVCNENASDGRATEKISQALLKGDLNCKFVEKNDARETAVMDKENTKTVKVKKTLGEVFDSMITDIMDNEDN